MIDTFVITVSLQKTFPEGKETFYIKYIDLTMNYT